QNFAAIAGLPRRKGDHPVQHIEPEPHIAERRPHKKKPWMSPRLPEASARGGGENNRRIRDGVWMNMGGEAEADGQPRRLPETVGNGTPRCRLIGCQTMSRSFLRESTRNQHQMECKSARDAPGSRG